MARPMPEAPPLRSTTLSSSCPTGPPDCSVPSEAHADTPQLAHAQVAHAQVGPRNCAISPWTCWIVNTAVLHA